MDTEKLKLCGLHRGDMGLAPLDSVQRRMECDGRPCRHLCPVLAMREPISERDKLVAELDLATQVRKDAFNKYDAAERKWKSAVDSQEKAQMALMRYDSNIKP